MINLAATDTLQGNAQTNSTVTVTVSGMELVGTTETYKKLYQGQPTTSVAALYTVAASTTAFIRSVHVVNTAASTQTFALYVSGAAGTNRITPDITLPANGFATYASDGWRVFNASGQLLGNAIALGTGTPATTDAGAGSAGTSVLGAPFDHDHQLSVATNALILGSAAAAGAATSTLRSNDTIAAFDATAVSAITPGAVSSTGSAAFAARRDHPHQGAGGVATIVATPGTFGAVETVIDKFQFPANFFVAGTTIRVSAYGTVSATAAGTVLGRIRLGTNGSTADTQVAATGATGAATAAIGWYLNGQLTIRTTGSGGTAVGNLSLVVQAGTPTISAQTATVAVNTTVANFVDITLIGGGTTPVVTVINTLVEVVKT